MTYNWGSRTGKRSERSRSVKARPAVIEVSRTRRVALTRSLRASQLLLKGACLLFRTPSPTSPTLLKRRRSHPQWRRQPARPPFARSCPVLRTSRSCPNQKSLFLTRTPPTHRVSKPMNSTGNRHPLDKDWLRICFTSLLRLSFAARGTHRVRLNESRRSSGTDRCPRFYSLLPCCSS